MDRSKLIKQIKEAAREGHGSRYNTNSRTSAGRYGGRTRNKLAEADKNAQQSKMPYEVNLNPELNSINQTR